MILYNLYRLEDEVKENLHHEEMRLKRIQSFKELLSELDFTAEKIPEDSPERLVRILESIKGRRLEQDELDLVEEIFKAAQ